MPARDDRHRTLRHWETITGPDHDTRVPCTCRLSRNHTYLAWLELPENQLALARARKVWAAADAPQPTSA